MDRFDVLSGMQVEPPLVMANEACRILAELRAAVRVISNARGRANAHEGQNRTTTLLRANEYAEYTRLPR